MIGFINIYKPSGVSSAFSVSKVKKLLHRKCGHMGTLDPLASGVLPIGVEQANRLFQYLLDKKKVYNATFDFAFSTPSFDLETEINKQADYLPAKTDIEAILPNYIGKIMQTPPIYSAKCVDGKRAYKLARHGKEVELEAKQVEISAIELLEQVSESAFSFRIECFGGTYIRSLARDFGECFSCAATMTKLERVQAGCFTKQNSVSVDELSDLESLEKYIIKPENVIDFPHIELSENTATRMLNGLFDSCEYADGLYSAYLNEEFCGVAEVANGVLKIKTYVRDLNK